MSSVWRGQGRGGDLVKKEGAEDAQLQYIAWPLSAVQPGRSPSQEEMEKKS